jgi:hypothetical protein
MPDTFNRRPVNSGLRHHLLWLTRRKILLFSSRSFHQTCREAFGFPDFYGMNMNAWIDCLTHLDEGDGMSRFHLASGETLNIEVPDTESFSAGA